MEHFGLYAGSYGLALERLLLDPVQVVIVGSGPEAARLEATAVARFAVNKTVMRIAPHRIVPGGIPEALEEMLLPMQPAEGRGVGAGVPRADMPAAGYRCGGAAGGDGKRGLKAGFQAREWGTAVGWAAEGLESHADLPIYGYRDFCLPGRGRKFDRGGAMSRLGSNAIRAVLAVCLAWPAVMPGQQYAFRAYRQAEGLKNLSINAMTVDRDGFVWLATENGVYRFLGSGFARYGPEQGIAGIDIRDIYADPGGMVWAGTDQGLFHWDGQRFVAAGPQGIGIATLRSLAAENASSLLVVDKGRLYRLEHDARGRTLSYRPVLADAQVKANPELEQTYSVSVVDDPARGREIWAGCGRKLYAWPDDGATQPYADAVKAWGAADGLSADQWQTVLVDHAGTVWAAGQRSIE